MEGTKSCPKCSGNVFVAWDIGDGEWYEYCLQCSYRHYLPALVEKASSTVADKGKSKKRKRKKNGKNKQ